MPEKKRARFSTPLAVFTTRVPSFDPPFHWTEAFRMRSFIEGHHVAKKEEIPILRRLDCDACELWGEDDEGFRSRLTFICLVAALAGRLH
jgi:hypothetical protein